MRIPLLDDIRKYNGSLFWADLIAGLTVAVLLIPQGMAYGLLAGLPPIYGLYAGLIPLLIYPILGTSRQLSIGPVAVVSIIVFSGLSNFATPGTAEFISLAILTSLVAGIIQVLLSVFRMGFLVNFLSHPVISGFMSAAAIIIALSQLKYILGIEIPSGSSVIETLNAIIGSVSQWNSIALTIGFSGLFLIVLFKKISRKIPGAIIVMLLAIAAVVYFGWESEGLNIVGNVPAGLPAFEIPNWSFDMVKQVLPLALIICLISFIESLSIAKTIEDEKKTNDLDANKELLALGAAKVIGSFFQAFPNTGSFARSAINNESGAKTGMSSIFAFLIIGLVLLFFTQGFYFLPKAILGAVIISAVFGLIDYKEAVYLFKHDRSDFIVFMATFLLTLILGVQNGVFAGIGLSLILIVRRMAVPHYAILGKLPNSTHFRNLERNPGTKSPEGALIFRYDSDLFFGNSDHFYQTILAEIQNYPDLEILILNFSAMNSPDSTSLHMLDKFIDHCKDNEIELRFTDVIGPIRDKFEKIGISEKLGWDNIFWSVEDACKDTNSFALRSTVNIDK